MNPMPVYEFKLKIILNLFIEFVFIYLPHPNRMCPMCRSLYYWLTMHWSMFFCSFYRQWNCLPAIVSWSWCYCYDYCSIDLNSNVSALMLSMRLMPSDILQIETMTMMEWLTMAAAVATVSFLIAE